MKLSVKFLIAALMISHAVLLWQLFSLETDSYRGSEITKIDQPNWSVQATQSPDFVSLSIKLDTVASQINSLNQAIASLQVTKNQHDTKIINNQSSSEPQTDESTMIQGYEETIYKLSPINQILNDGVITQSSLNELRASMSDIPESQHHTVMRTLIVEINKGTLVLEDGVFL